MNCECCPSQVPEFALTGICIQPNIVCVGKKIVCEPLEKFRFPVLFGNYGNEGPNFKQNLCVLPEMRMLPFLGVTKSSPSLFCISVRFPRLHFHKPNVQISLGSCNGEFAACRLHQYQPQWDQSAAAAAAGTRQPEIRLLRGQTQTAAGGCVAHAWILILNRNGMTEFK